MFITVKTNFATYTEKAPKLSNLLPVTPYTFLNTEEKMYTRKSTELPFFEYKN